jgi:hypothetical protein
MANLYPGTSVSGYNANPPPDDGTTGSTNLITWAGIKSKIGDPLDTFAVAVDSNLSAAFGKTLDGAGVVKTSVNYAMTAADQGRLIVATVSGITITTPDAGTVNAPFMAAINNQSTGSITLAGNATGGQTVDGATTQTISRGSGCVVKTDGTNWFTFGLSGASLTLADQTLSGGANVTSANLGTQTTGTLTIDCGLCPLQYVVNGGAFTLAAPANDGTCLLRVLNNVSAGAITFSGFTVGSNTGDALTTANGAYFTISIWRIGAISSYFCKALQ